MRWRVSEALVDARARLGGDLAPESVEPKSPAPLEAPPAPASAIPRLADLAAGAALLLTFTMLGRESARLQSLVPDTVAGFLLLTLVLVAAERRPAWRRPVVGGVVPLARLLLRHMGVLFVPAGVVGLQGLLDMPVRLLAPVLLALLVSTLLGLAATALVAAGWRRA